MPSDNLTIEELSGPQFILLTPGTHVARTGPTHNQLLINTSLDKLQPLLDSAAKSKYLALDFETKGADYSLEELEIVGVGLAWDTGSLYLDWWSSPENCKVALINMLLAHRGLLAHNVYFDGGVFYREVNQHAPWHVCTYALLAMLHNESPEARWGLKEAQVSLLGWTNSNEGELDEWLCLNGYYKGNTRADDSVEHRAELYAQGKLRPEKGEMWRAPAYILGKYCCLDAEACYLLFTRILEPVMNKFTHLREFFLQEFMHLIIQHIDQKMHGILVDREGLRLYGEDLKADIKQLSDQFIQDPRAQEGIRFVEEDLRAEVFSKKITQFNVNGKVSKNYTNWLQKCEEIREGKHEAFNFNINSGDQLRKIFYDVLKYPVEIETEKGQPAVSIKAMKKMGDLGNIIVERADRTKALSFVDAYMELTEHRNTVHPSFRVPGTVTGRLSGREPNLQQCFHPDVEILTKRGWVKILEVTMEDKVWQVIPNQGKVTGEWVTPEQITSREYSGNMLSFNNQRINTAVTMDHRMLLFGAHNQPYLHYEHTAEEMYNSMLRHHLKVCTSFPEIKLDTFVINDIWSACLVQADGSTARQNNINVWRFGFRKTNKINYMKNKYGDPNYIDKHGTHCWYSLEISSPYLEAKTKSINLDNLPDGYGSIVVEAIAHWDGNNRKTDVIWQSNCLRSIDSVQRYLVRNGYQAKYWSRITEGKERHCLTIRKDPRISILHSHKKLIHYSGKVGCLSVPSEYILTRYKGQTLVIGQCPKTKSFMSRLIARPGNVIIDSDFNALEPHVLAEFSQDKNMLLLYGDGRPANDIYCFIMAAIPGMGERARALGYDPINPTKESLALVKKEMKHERNICKVVALSCGYGASARKVHQSLEEQNIFLTMQEVEKVHSGYWETFAQVKDFERSLYYEWKRNKGYIINGIGRPMAVSEDYTKDLLNRFVQSTGHDILTIYVRILCNNLSKYKIPYVPCIIDFHDSVAIELPEQYAKQTIEVFNQSMNELNKLLGSTVTLKGSPNVGTNLAEVKEAEE